MAVIKVIARIGGTIHPKYGLLEQGKEYEIEEADFGDEIFEVKKEITARINNPKQHKKEE